MKNKFLLIIILLISLGFAYFFYFRLWPVYQSKKYEQNLASVARELREQMTLPEKVGQLFHIGLPGEKLDPATRKLIHTIHPGGIILLPTT